MNGYFKLFVLVCSLLAIVRSSPIGRDEILETSQGQDDAEHRMLVWPPHINKKNVTSDQEELRSPSTTSAVLRNSNAGDTENKSDISKEEEIKLRSEEQANNDTQGGNQSSKNESHNIPVINKNFRMTNWVNNLPTESNPASVQVDIDSIQLTTSEPEIIPSVETVAVFRNAGSWHNGSNSYDVEVAEVTTNVTQDISKNQSQDSSGGSILQRNLESSSVNPDDATTEGTESEEEIEVKKTHILEIHEHNTEIYGKTAAEELAELSVIDVLLRKRRNQEIERSQPDLNNSEESSESIEEESGEVLRSGKPSSEVQNITIILPHNVNDTKTISQPIRRSEDENNGTSSSSETVILSPVKDLKTGTETLPEITTKTVLNNTNSTTINHLEVTHPNYLLIDPTDSEIQPVTLPKNTTHNKNTSTEVITSQTVEKKEKIHLFKMGKSDVAFNSSLVGHTNISLATGNDSLTKNENSTFKSDQIPYNSPVSKTLSARHSDQAVINNSSSEFSNNTTENNPSNKTINAQLAKSNFEVSKHTVHITTDLSRSDDETVDGENEEINITTETSKSKSSNSSLPIAKGKNLNTTGEEQEHSTENKLHTVVSHLNSNLSIVSSTTHNYNEEGSKHESNSVLSSEQSTSKPTEREFEITQVVTTSTIKEPTTSDKESIFQGFKSIADYIGFAV